jgi:hypothetical protein
MSLKKPAYVDENPDANYSEEEKAWMIERRFEDWKYNWSNGDGSAVKQNDECIMGVFGGGDCPKPRIPMQEVVFIGKESNSHNLSMYCKEHMECFAEGILDDMENYGVKFDD